MKQSFVKMMNRIAEMENCILKGLVLDDLGNWVPIADRKAVEEDTLAHLSSGQVLFEGRWVNFPELKKTRSRRVEKPPCFSGRVFFRKTTAAPVSAPQPAPPTPDTSLLSTAPEPETSTAGGRKETPPPIKEPAAPDTSIIIMTPEPEKTAAGTHATEPTPVKEPAAPETSLITVALEPERKTAGGRVTAPPSKKETAAPETSIIDISQKPERKTAGGQVTAPPPKKETAISETSIIVHEPPPSLTHPESGHDEFPPETKIILFKPPDHQAQGASDTHLIPKPGDTQLLKLPKPAPAQEETPEPKNRMVIIIGGVAAAAVVAAILYVVVQMVR
jgi:hypothetical protein